MGWAFLVIQWWQNLGRKFGASRMHLSPLVAWAAVLSRVVVLLLSTCCVVIPIVGVCNCYLFCCTLLNVHSCIAIIFMGKREMVDLISLSSWCLVIVVWLFLAVPWVVCSL